MRSSPARPRRRSGSWASRPQAPRARSAAALGNSAVGRPARGRARARPAGPPRRAGARAARRGALGQGQDRLRPSGAGARAHRRRGAAGPPAPHRASARTRTSSCRAKPRTRSRPSASRRLEARHGLAREYPFPRERIGRGVVPARGEVAMRRRFRVALVLGFAVLLPGRRCARRATPRAAAARASTATPSGSTGACVIVDAQRVCPAPGLKFKGEGEASSFALDPARLRGQGQGQAPARRRAARERARGQAQRRRRCSRATLALGDRPGGGAVPRQDGRFVRAATRPRSGLGRLDERGRRSSASGASSDKLLPRLPARATTSAST